MRAGPEATGLCLSALIDSTTDLIWVVDRHFRLVTFNRATAEGYRLSYGKELVVGLGLDDILPSEERPYWKELYQRVLTGAPLTEIYEKSQNGSTQFVELCLHPVRVD